MAARLAAQFGARRQTRPAACLLPDSHGNPFHGLRFPHTLSRCPRGTDPPRQEFPCRIILRTKELTMGRYLLLWLLGIPLPILALIWIFGGLH
ncbi:MAG: hypothetical protein KIT76_02855 [Pseudolabrys sp.]|nr:hypothetical protein [Pseudolabrys sp.]